MIYITHEKSGGRAGHQYKDAITPLIVAEIFDFTYVYTDYSSLEIFNLRRGKLCRENLPDNIPVRRVEGPYWRGVDYDKLMSEFSNLHVQYQDQDCLVVLAKSFRVQLFQVYNWHKDGQLKTNVYERVMHTLREDFRARNSQYETDTGQNKTKVAVHIRRGDVAKNPKRRSQSSQHYVHNMEYFDAILSRIRNQLNDRKTEIHIFTEYLHADDVVAYCQEWPDILLHQGGKAEFADHFAQMVYSDILVVSNSSMSQMAGYLCEGLKIYHPNDQYHSLPEDEFIPVHALDEPRISGKLTKKSRKLGT